MTSHRDRKRSRMLKSCCAADQSDVAVPLTTKTRVDLSGSPQSSSVGAQRGPAAAGPR